MPMGAIGWMMTMPMMIKSQRVRTRRSFTVDCADWVGSLAMGPFEIFSVRCSFWRGGFQSTSGDRRLSSDALKAAATIQAQSKRAGGTPALRKPVLRRTEKRRRNRNGGSFCDHGFYCISRVGYRAAVPGCQVGGQQLQGDYFHDRQE